MDVQASLSDDSINVVTGDGQISFLENDSFFARAPPLAASTVGRTKSRRCMQESEMGSFLDDRPSRASPFDNMGPSKGSTMGQGPYIGPGERQGGDVPARPGEDCDWSEYDGKSSLGILDVDDMDVLSANLLLEGPMDDLLHRDGERDAPLEDNQRGTFTDSQQSNQSSQYSQYKSSLKEQGSSDLAGWSSSQNSLDAKPDQPFASSQLMTVKKGGNTKEKPDEPVTAVIRQMLFGQTPIGEEGEEPDISVHLVEIGEQDLNDLDDDFDMDLTTGEESDKEEGGTTPVNKHNSASAGGESKLDSMYLRPGVAGEESHTSRLPYLSKVSLFEVGSESEIDTEDELEQARKIQGRRVEAAGEASQQASSRPGVVGHCSDDSLGLSAGRQVPIAQRQSAEGDAVSPIPGDGGGGGDGSSGSESDDARRTNQGSSQNISHNYHGNRQSEDQEEQRIRPMGDDLLSEMRALRYNSDPSSLDDRDTKLDSRYLAAISQAPDDTDTNHMNVEDYFLSQDLEEGFQDFDPSNRLEASGFNADDDQRPNSNPFGAMESSFGSFGMQPDRLSGSLLSHEDPSGHSAEKGNTSWSRIRPDTGGSGGGSGGDDVWRQLDESGTTSRGSHASSRARSTSPGCHGNVDYQQGVQNNSRDGSLGCRSAASGSPSSLSEKRMAATGSPSVGQSAGFVVPVTKPSSTNSSTDFRNEPVFKKPAIPVPKVASQNSFRKSFVKPSTSTSSSRKISGTGSSLSPASSGSEYVDLAVKMSLAALTGEAEEQREQLKRVPSLGGTSMMDLTVHDDEFFGNDDALAMLDGDEEEFEKDNKIRQDEVMNVKDPSAGDDSWQYNSIMTIARPSWLEDAQGEEVVRISVGTFMRSRTEALGSLDGVGREPRPDFGMKVNSPPRVKPSQLIEEEEGQLHEARTSGVGQYENTATPTRHKSTDGDNTIIDDDDTLTMSKLGLPPLSESTAKLSMGELSQIIMSEEDINSKVQKLYNLHTSKSKQKASETAAIKLKSPRSTQLPVKKGSSLNKSLLKSGDSPNLSPGTQVNTSQEISTDVGAKVLDKDTDKDVDVSKQVPKTDSEPVSRVSPDLNTLPPPSRESLDELWSSPNASSCAASTVGLFERLEEFQFSSANKVKQSHLRQNLFTKKDQSVIGRLGTEPEQRSLLDRDVQQPKHDANQKRRDFGKDENNMSVSKSEERRFNDSSRSISGAMDHGYMLGHHIPDGTEYSERSDYSHMNHKGMQREDVAGMDEDGLVESRGFDMLQRRSSAKDLSKGHMNSSAESKNILGEKRMQANTNVQPTETSSGLLMKVLQSRHSSSSTRMGEQDKATEDNIETSDLQRFQRLESWTQTPSVLKQNIGLQPDFQPVEDKHPGSRNSLEDHYADDRFEKDFRKENLPPKLPVSSFQHDLLRNTQSAVPEKPHLLTKTSLMKTDFAEDNLRRNFSIEVMDKIYDSSNAAGFTQLCESRISSASNFGTQHRDQMEFGHWTQVRESLNEGEMSSISEIHGSYGRRPMAQSTPFHQDGQRFFAERGLAVTTSNHPHGRLSDAGSAQGSKTSPPKDHASLSMVEAPSMLHFEDACCVGISKTEALHLTNPTDRWMECLLQVKCLEVDGRPSELTNFPFEFRQKVIINPNKSEMVDIMFLPKFAGAYVAQLQLFSSAFVRKEDIKRNMIPVNITLQAIAEKPWIKVVCDNDESNVVDFGEMVWGSCREKAVTIYNYGLASVPLRLAITSNKSWHCFSFEGTCDVSIISGTRQLPVTAQGRSIVNINIPGSAYSQKNCSCVKIWCKPPDKQITKAQARQSAEEFSCTLNIDVDTPSSKLPTLASVRLKVKVGTQKLHVQSSIQEIRLAAAPMKTQESMVKITNAGNLGFEVSFGFTASKEVFSVKPIVTYLPPGGFEDVTVTFHPQHSDTHSYESELLMYIQPEGPLFEMKLEGKVLQPSSGPFKLLCDCTHLNLGGVPLNRTLVRRFRLINKNEESINMTAESRVEEVMLADSPEPTSAVSRVRELHIKPEETISVYTVCSPTYAAQLRGKIVMRILDTHAPKYTVTVSGYCGTSRLVCPDDSPGLTTVRGYSCVAILGKSHSEHSQTILVKNVGCRPAKVSVTAYKDFECTRWLDSSHVRVQHADFLIPEGMDQRLKLVVNLRPEEVETNTLQHGVGAVLCLSYTDDVETEKRYRSRLVIGLAQRSASKGDHGNTHPPHVFATPAFSSRTMSRIPPQHKISLPQNRLSFTDNLPSHRSEDGVSTVSGTKTDNTSGWDFSTKSDNVGGWEIRPSQLILYCSNKGPSEELDKFYIYNNRNRDISFEMIWPAGMLSLKPDRGSVKAREMISILIFPSSEACKHLDELPWSGTVLVQCDGNSKPLRVQIRHDKSADSRTVDLCTSPRSQIPVSLGTTLGTTLPAAASAKTLGSVEVSRTTIQFSQTSAGKVAQETLLLTNMGSDMVRWIFSSFAPPYLKKASDQKKEMVRVTYKVFDFSRQFGKLSGQSSLQLLLHFMPRSAGTFLQYWDLQLTGNPSGASHAAKNDFIRIQLSGEGVEVPEPKVHTCIEDVTASLKSLSYESGNKVKLQEDHLKFNSLRPGEKITHKVELKNSHPDTIKVDVVNPKAPFFIKHHSFKISGKRYLRLPVDFSPTQLGMYTEIVTFYTETGQKLELKLSGECTLDDTIMQHGH